MSVINRIEVVNFLNTNGEREQAAWEPKYRQVVLDLRGQSTAVNMMNGCGKTSIAEAVTGMLARDSQLISRTRTKMAPAKSNTFSHFRVEFLVTTRNISQRELMLDANNTSVGETWVFGMCGFRGANEHPFFYYYPGRLEDTPLAQRIGNKVTLLGNNFLQGYRKTIVGFQWGLDTESWRTALAEHVSSQMMQRNAQYQKMGAGDKSAELFSVKARRGESFDAAFFYEVLAPELLSGLMDEEGEDDEKDFEDTVIITIDRVLKAKHNTERKNEELTRAGKALEAIAETAKKAATCANARSAYEARRVEVAKNARLLHDLAITCPLPGVPRSSAPEGLAGQIFPHLVIEPGKGLHVLDHGLSILLGREVKHVNELAGRHNIRRGKPSLIIELGGNPDSVGPPRGGHGSTSYSLSDAQQLLARSNVFADGVTLQKANDALSIATKWFEEKCDTNPFRPLLLVKERDVQQRTQEADDLDRQIVEANASLATLEKQERDFRDNESYYGDLVDSGLFSSEELAQPSRTKGIVAREYDAAQEQQRMFTRHLTLLESLLPHWQAFCKTYGDDADPRATDGALMQQETRTQQNIQALRLQLRDNLKTQQNSQADLIKQKTVLARTEETLRQFSALAPRVMEYHHRFGETDCATLDRTVVNRLAELRAEIKSAEGNLTRLSEQVGFIQAFHAQHGLEAVPAQVLAAWEMERNRLLIEKQETVDTLESLTRRRSQLDNAQIAAGDTAQLALDALTHAGVVFLPVHAVVDSLNLDGVRQRKALSSLSALLFAPVIERPDDAARAVAVLQKQELPLPIFIADRFIDYVRHTDLTVLQDPPAAYGLIAGIPTRAVECLLDPTLVEREKLDLDTSIEKTRQILSELVLTLQSLDPEAAAVQQVRRAADALRADAQQLHANAQHEILQRQNELPIAEENASTAAIKVIQGMQRFMEMSGETGRKHNELERDRVAQLLKTIEISLDTLSREAETVASDLKTAEDRLPTIYPITLRAQIQNAIAFNDDGGPAFMVSAEEERRRVQEALDRAINRQKFGEMFERAQLYLDTKQRVSEYVAEITRLKQFIPGAETKRQGARVLASTQF